MKNPQVLLNSLIIIFLTSFYSCVSSQTKQNNLNKININWLVDHYINFYSNRNKKFNPKDKYLMISISENTAKKQTDIYITDNCYECPGVKNDNYLIVLYKGFRIVIATDTSKTKALILKKFKNTSTGAHFSVKPFQDNVIYDYPRQWNITYDDKQNLIFFCNPIMNELTETKEILGLSNSVEDCNPLQNSKPNEK